MQIDVLSTIPDVLGESPVWSVAEQALYWIDLRAPALRRMRLASGEVETWPLPEIVGSVVLRASGGVVLGLKSGLFGFDPADGTLSLLLPVDEGHEGNRLNDAKVDRRGNLWFSTMWDFGLHPTGALYRVDAVLRLQQMRAEAHVPNAICFSPDGSTLYFADTRTRCLEAAMLDSTGQPGTWRVLDSGEAAPGNPDGATVDAEGCIWNARYTGGAVVRFAPDGRIDRVIELPVSQPTSCAFGGPGLDTLFVTTARQKLGAQQLASEPHAGHLLALRPGVIGLAEPQFAG